MNVIEINGGALETISLATYVESTVILTAVTAWVIIALQEHSSFHPGGRNVLRRAAWPAIYGYLTMRRMITVALGRLRSTA